MSENLDNEQRARLWEHRLHVETQMYGRVNLFLVIETILMVVVGTLFTKPDPPQNMLIILIVLGVLITLIWIYLQDRVKHVFEIVDERALHYLPEYKVTIERIGKGRWPFRTNAPTLPLLTYFVPVLILLAWIFFLLFLLHWLS